MQDRMAKSANCLIDEDDKRHQNARSRNCREYEDARRYNLETMKKHEEQK